MQPENKATCLYSIPACRQRLRTRTATRMTYTELWGDPCQGHSISHCCGNLWGLNLFVSPTALHCWTHKHRNIYCTWNVIWCLSVLASDGLEGKREGRLREWMSEEISCKHEGWAGVWIQWLHPIELHSNTKLVATAPPGGPHVKHCHGTFYRCPG